MTHGQNHSPPTAGALQELAGPANNRPVSRRLDWIKWAIWLPWLAGIILFAVRAGGCPMSLAVHDMVKASRMENDECILCGTCVDNCPQGAIHFTFSAGK